MEQCACDATNMGKKAPTEDAAETETETSGDAPLGIMATKPKKKSISKAIKAGLVFPVSKINRHLRDAKKSKRVGAGGPIYLAGVLEYTAAEIFEMAMTRLGKRKRITTADVLCGVRSDRELNILLAGASVFANDRVKGVSQVVTIKNPVKP